MQVPVHVTGVAVCVRVAVETLAERYPQAEGAERNQEHAADDLAGALEQHGDLPSQHDDGRRSEQQQQRMTEREAEGNAHRVRPLTLVTRGAHRECGDSHEMVGAEPVDEPERQRVGRQDHSSILPRCCLITVMVS